jgi:hypothetical protein
VDVINLKFAVRHEYLYIKGGFPKPAFAKLGSLLAL